MLVQLPLSCHAMSGGQSLCTACLVAVNSRVIVQERRLIGLEREMCRPHHL